MKRIYEFRGRTTKLELWLYGSLVIHEGKNFIVFENAKIQGDSLIDGLIEVTSQSIGQFTELYDKNGKKIYAGDIVKWINNFKEKIIGWVRYTRSIAGFHLVLIKGGCVPFYNYEGGKTEENFEWNRLEIVGNKTENPEMMKAKYWRSLKNKKKGAKDE